MDPFTLAMMGSTAISALGKIFGGEQQSKQDLAAAAQADTQAQIQRLQGNLAGINAVTDKTNVDLLNDQATIAAGGVDLAYAAGRVQEGRILAQGRETLASQRVYFAGRNIDPTFGSPLLAQGLTASRVAADVDLTRANTAVAAAGALTKSANIMGQAAGAAGRVVNDIGTQLSSVLSADSSEARAASLRDKSSADETAGWLGAASSVLGGVAGLGKAGFSMPSINLSSIGFDPISGISGA